MSGAAEIGSVQILCYARRGERSVQTAGGASVQIYAPPLRPRMMFWRAYLYY